MANSSALLILQGCGWRVCSPDARFIIHNVEWKFSMKLNGRTTCRQAASAVRKIVGKVHMLQSQIDEVLLRHGTLSRARLLRLAHFGSKFRVQLPAERMRHYGFIDEIATLNRADAARCLRDGNFVVENELCS
jgi:ATP-dependent protease ClpP protease subunit